MESARTYRSITPATNVFLKKKWDEARYRKHRLKIDSMKASLDNKPPRAWMHLHVNSKKVKMEEDRKAVIKRDNYLLLEKMAHIMKTRGRIDNINDYHPRSLNCAKRQRDMLRIAHENQALLKRIEAREPYYHHMHWVDQWRQNESYRAICGKYPQFNEPREFSRRFIPGGLLKQSMTPTPLSSHKIRLRVVDDK